MALRVLLADESTTIKKVIQLALQDYGVQVKNVNVGVDALEVAHSFRPDIVFADTLLQKKSGYEVCEAMKRDPLLSQTPVVLMWSGFLGLDQQEFQKVRGDDQLEKPFNVDSLRAIIQKWVPKTQTQVMSGFLEFPNSIRQLREEPQANRQAQATPPPQVQAQPTPRTPPPPPSLAKAPQEPPPSPDLVEIETWSMDSFQDIESFMAEEEAKSEGPKLEMVQEPVFSEVQLSEFANSYEAQATNDPGIQLEEVPEPDADEPWLTKDLSKFKLNIPDTEEDPVETAGETDFSAYSQTSFNHSFSRDDDSIEPVRRSAEAPEPVKPSQIPAMSAEQIEKILRAQSHEIIEAVVLKIVPEMASQMIRSELERLLREEEIR